MMSPKEAAKKLQKVLDEIKASHLSLFTDEEGGVEIFNPYNEDSERVVIYHYNHDA